MKDFYEAYYNAVATSRAHAKFCEYAYGRNLAQHGFLTMDALKFLLEVTRLGAGGRVLDIGCGNGEISEWISDATGAHVTGMDYIVRAVMRAQARTRDKRARMDFFAGDLNRLPCAPQSFDLVLSIDTLYFGDDYAVTLQDWAQSVRAGGRLAIFFSHGADPQHPVETFDRATLPPERTPVGLALRANGMQFETWDFTADDLALGMRKLEILDSLHDEFQAEGNLFLYENRMGETSGVLAAHKAGMYARYLYLVTI